ncbi:MAG: hypothetical protein ACRC62_36930 [Microcoleus sp.]
MQLADRRTASARRGATLSDYEMAGYGRSVLARFKIQSVIKVDTISTLCHRQSNANTLAKSAEEFYQWLLSTEFIVELPPSKYTIRRARLNDRFESVDAAIDAWDKQFADDLKVFRMQQSRGPRYYPQED